MQAIYRLPIDVAVFIVQYLKINGRISDNITIFIYTWSAMSCCASNMWMQANAEVSDGFGVTYTDQPTWLFSERLIYTILEGDLGFPQCVLTGLTEVE